MKRFLVVCAVVIGVSVPVFAGIGAGPAAAATSTVDRMRDCLALGGGLIPCCAAVGGHLTTVIIDGKEVLVCEIDNTPGNVQNQTGAAHANINAVGNSTGPTTSSDASGGQSKAGQNGLIAIYQSDPNGPPVLCCG